MCEIKILRNYHNHAAKQCVIDEYSKMSTHSLEPCHGACGYLFGDIAFPHIATTSKMAAHTALSGWRLGQGCRQQAWLVLRSRFCGRCWSYTLHQ